MMLMIKVENYELKIHFHIYDIYLYTVTMNQPRSKLTNGSVRISHYPNQV